jgi:hypothetical protein
MRFIDVPIAKDPYAKGAQKFTWRNRKGLVKIHPHWAQAPNHQLFYFDGTEIITLEENRKPFD